MAVRFQCLYVHAQNIAAAYTVLRLDKVLDKVAFLEQFLLGLLHHFGRKGVDRQALDDFVVTGRADDGEGVIESLASST